MSNEQTKEEIHVATKKTRRKEEGNEGEGPQKRVWKQAKERNKKKWQEPRLQVCLCSSTRLCVCMCVCVMEAQHPPSKKEPEMCLCGQKEKTQETRVEQPKPRKRRWLA